MCTLAIMPPQTPLSPKSANTHISKKIKAPRIELSSHKCAVIEGIYKVGMSIKTISEIKNTLPLTVYTTIKKLNIRPKGYSLPYFGHPHLFSKAKKQLII